MVKVGDKAPEFELLDQDGETVSLSGLQGHKVGGEDRADPLRREAPPVARGGP